MDLQAGHVGKVPVSEAKVPLSVAKLLGFPAGYRQSFSDVILRCALFLARLEGWPQ
jgi:hypothetical protein